VGEAEPDAEPTIPTTATPSATHDAMTAPIRFISSSFRQLRDPLPQQILHIRADAPLAVR
jgi:hypothetical protein